MSSIVMITFLRFNILFFTETATTEIYTLSLHDALPIFVREAGHLVNEQASRCSLRGQLGICGADIMDGHGIRRAVAAEVPPRHGNREDRGVLRPVLVEFHQNPQHLLEILGIILGGHQISPGLLVVAGGCPAGRLEKACENRRFHGLVRESAWTPAIADELVNRMIGYRCFVHVLDPFSSALLR